MQQPKKRSKTQSYWPVIGLLLLLSCAAIAYVVGEPLFTWFKTSHVIKGFPPSGVPASNLQWLLRGIVFVVLGLFASLVVAAAAPKKKSVVTEKQMTKQREEMVREKKARKLRQQKMNKMNKGR